MPPFLFLQKRKDMSKGNNQKSSKDKKIIREGEYVPISADLEFDRANGKGNP